MFIAIEDLLDGHEVAAVRETAANLAFEDGRKTAGRFAREVKANAQAAASPQRDAILKKVEEALAANPLFSAAARPKRIVRLLLSRYCEGQTYGSHVDDALMGGARTDLSFTLFLSNPESYEGGALVVEDALEERAIKLPEGHLFLYPSNTLHRVEPVTGGERLAVVGWVESWIREAERREILFDLEQSLNAVHAAEGKTALFDRLAKTRSNLLRMWAG
ncbi:Fe2+-dependent dioxygenase [Rhizobiales bacterium]|uniref:Fe2+-dependent dioxygenase n=1 Tax=Hongsoonwoonella zoysiae TaxID=2821844 RepID=UPI0015614248|nr:Fe2+-dependent dioxygenase [Hongsoonwoonella zoysiae]NRG16735.1 Fe2+-dependent dioxygenase [Hongsoonwoonella zoysiae]